MSEKKESLEAERKRVIETLGVYFEKEKQIAPLAARILSLLCVNGRKGTTFDTFVMELEASKSSISTQLSALEHLQWINYFTKCGDRKRYYRVIPGYITRRISGLNSQWRKEIEIQKDMIHYKTEYNKVYPEDAFPIAAHQEVVSFLQGAIDYFEEQINNYNKNNKDNNIEEL